MKKFIIILVLVLVACNPKNNPNITPILPSPTETPFQGYYKVTKATGLYEAPNLDAKMEEELEKGTLLEHANGAETIWCTSFEAEGMKYELCHMEVYNTGRTGWVLRQWFK
jgi:hypothetical protein